MIQEPTPVLPGVHVAVGSPLAVNAVVIHDVGRDGGEAVIVDTTGTVGQGRALARFVVETLNARLIAVVNTHGHSDHSSGNAGALDEDVVGPRAPLAAHRRWFETRRRERAMISRSPAADNLAELRHPGVLLEARTVLRCGSLELGLIPAPGHSPDLTMVYEPRRRLLIASDNLLAGPKPGKRAIPYFYWGDPWQLIAALELARSLAPECIIPGHGAPLHGEHATTALDFSLDYLRRLLEAAAELPRDLEQPAWDEPPTAWKEALPPEALLDKTPPEWVRRMHELNLLRLYLGVSFPG